MVRGLVDLMCGDYSAVLAAFDEVDTTQETVSEFAVMHPMIRADGLAWVGDLEGARPLIDRGLRMAEIYSDCSTHGWLAMVGLRVEADVAAAATTAGDIDAIERAEVRARAIVDAWDAARAQLQTQHPLVLAYARACDAEMARLRGDGVVEAAIAAAAEFDAISMPYYATYFRWRAAEAALAADDRRTGIPLLEQARGMARQHGFAGLDAVVTTLARTYQLRIGPGKTTVDGDEPLSVRELEVLRLMADGKSNPEIGDILSISRRTAAAHVSSVLRKLDVTTRAEAASAAVRGGLV
ncbi:MAG: helix-turn-helix transcriptional regulator [Actinomycetota bacterium]|nr:helix-turn-helix transcriptional regulator [Actinomycetota bacterium]